MSEQELKVYNPEENLKKESSILKKSDQKVSSAQKIDDEDSNVKRINLTPNDSRDPSYTNLELPYRVICRQRYQKAATQQRLQFLKEIRKQEMSQSKALSGVRIHRVFVNPVRAPPSPSEIIKLTPKQQFKLEQLLNE